MQEEITKIHLSNFHIAGFGYWQGCEAFANLHIGTELNLVREQDNRFDPYAVAIYHCGLKLGYIPRLQNHDISKYLDMGWREMFEVRITRITPDAHPESQIEVILYVVSNDQKIT